MQNLLALYLSGTSTTPGVLEVIHPNSRMEILGKDLAVSPAGDKPLWPLTSFGPGKHEPNVTGALDESFEELRWKAVQAKLNNTINDYVSVTWFNQDSRLHVHIDQI